MIATLRCQTTKRNHIHIVGLSPFQRRNVLHKATVNPLETDDDAGGVQSGTVVEKSSEDNRALQRNGKCRYQLLQ